MFPGWTEIERAVSKFENQTSNPNNKMAPLLAAPLWFLGLRV
jgi:hypothetical protein